MIKKGKCVKIPIHGFVTRYRVAFQHSICLRQGSYWYLKVEAGFLFCDVRHSFGFF